MPDEHRQPRSRSLRDQLRRDHEMVDSLKERQDRKRSPSEKLADWMTITLGGMPFLMTNVVWFAVWIVLNADIIPGLEPFDPFPFGLLTMIVSLEAIILAIFVLISQNRAAKVADLRAEMDLQVDMLAERELTKLLGVVSAIAEKQGIELARDEELQSMLQPAPMHKIEAALEEQVVGKPPSLPTTS
jgi:uncharacterized membrane protein